MQETADKLPRFVLMYLDVYIVIKIFIGHVNAGRLYTRYGYMSKLKKNQYSNDYVFQSLEQCRCQVLGLYPT